MSLFLQISLHALGGKTQLNEALVVLSQAIEYKSDHTEAWLYRGHVYLE